MRARLRRPTTAIALAAIAAAVLAGCGSDDEGGDDNGSATATPEVVEVRDVDAPEADADLVEAVGAQAAVLTGAGCTMGTYELGDPDHVDVGTDLDSPSFPPTSGPHYPDWAPFGLYDEPVPDGNAIHNLEHGGVVVWLGVDVDEATTDAVAGLLDDDEKWLVAPRPDIAGLFSAAWGLGLSCPPSALTKLGPEATATALDAWYEAVESTGSPAEKDVPAYAGAMKEPAPVRDISTEAPF
jgi:hypothetical protein